MTLATSALIAAARSLASLMGDAAGTTMICVGTTTAANGSQDQSALVRLAHDHGRSLREKSASHEIDFRSTMVPGTVEDVLTPIMERESGKTNGVGFHVAFQPEFLREGKPAH